MAQGTSIERDRLSTALGIARRDLLAARTRQGHWVGRLSSSALSTATAASALALVVRQTEDQAHASRLSALLARGLEWIVRRQNADGGWGDTEKSLSNIATTMLVRAALHLAGAADAHGQALARAEPYLQQQGGVEGLRRRYGKDKTFAVPILANCALAGLVDWEDVAPLPFEMACLPHALLGLVRLPVVSYAIPALVAIGQARFVHAPPRNPLVRMIRRRVVEKSLAVVERMQPASGGFLEATPLTSFVVMSLSSIGRVRHPIVRRGVEFLAASIRDDGSWPIDTNLATWVTTLSINALAAGGEDVAQRECLEWLLACQHRDIHPFTRAAPGGWGWTDLSGAVPDADDTCGALLALASLRRSATSSQLHQIDVAAGRGLVWLLNLQNRDGGWPTFCRGWGALPFDRSGVDLTAHALRAIGAWRDVASPLVWSQFPWRRLPGGTCGLAAAPSDLRDGTDGKPLVEEAMPRSLRRQLDRAALRGWDFICRSQRPDGSWVPLWFGNQFEPSEENPVYGTSRVLLALADGAGRLPEDSVAAIRQMTGRGLAWLVESQNADGGWGGGPAGSGSGTAKASGVEETALALEGLLAAGADPRLQGVVAKGLAWLLRAVDEDRHREPSPIGFYFAKLWYDEALYPLIYTVSALGRAVRREGVS